jgi:outer membrane protein assembly factor BamE (lipoprotein component of BamABCDE complex)
MTKYGAAFLLAGLAFAGLGGCVSVRSSHGYILERGSNDLTAEVGLDTKESVLAKYGEPSMIGTFNPNAWYYMASMDRARAFFKPETQYREIVAFYFNDKDVVSDVQKIALADGMDVKISSRTTPTRGKELGFWEQLLGNVGKLPTTEQGQGPPQ